MRNSRIDGAAMRTGPWGGMTGQGPRCFLHPLPHVDLRLAPLFSGRDAEKGCKVFIGAKRFPGAAAEFGANQQIAHRIIGRIGGNKALLPDIAKQLIE